MTKSTLHSIGEELKRARELKSLTVLQVQQKTKIHSSIITALEEGGSDETLSATYLKSFLKKYAEFLALDANRLAKSFAAVQQDVDTGKAILSVGSVPSQTHDLFSMFVSLVSTLLIVVALVFIVRFLVIKITGPKPQRAKAPAAAQETRSTKAKPETAHTYVPSVKMASSKAKNAPAPDLEAPRKVASAPLKVSQSTPSSLAPFTAELKVKARTLIKVKKDGVSLYERVLPKGSAEIFRCNSKLEIFTAKGEAIEIIVNGKSLGSPGRGVIRHVEVTAKGMKVKYATGIIKSAEVKSKAARTR